MVLYTHLLCRGVQPKKERKAPARELARIGRTDDALGDVVHHFAVDEVRRTVGNDMAGLNRRPVCKHDALYAVLAREDPDCLGIHMNLAAQFEEALDHCERDLMRAGFGADRTAQDVAVDHGGIVRKAHVLEVRAQIAPVSAQNILCLLRHLQRSQYFVDRIRAATDEVAVVLYHILGVRLAVDGIAVRLRKAHFLGKSKELFRRLSAAGDVLLHTFDKCLYPKGHGRIEPLRFADDTVGIGN